MIGVFERDESEQKVEAKNPHAEDLTSRRTVDPVSNEITIRFTGEPDQLCTYDTSTGQITDCAP
ncbi:MAG: hypothetical protein OEV36_10430 [Myxococcales bacterium]|nr:hypothetical protein [Myxococcales bacterium]